MSIDFGVRDGGIVSLAVLSANLPVLIRWGRGRAVFDLGPALVWAGEDRTKDEGPPCFIDRFHPLEVFL